MRLTHWLNVPLLLGLAASGLSIYWAAPVLRDPGADVPRHDVLARVGVAIASVLHDRGRRPEAWIYDHLGLGTGQLAVALRLHWLLAYAFMLNGALYLIGLVAGGGWRALAPRASDARETVAMLRYYAGVIPMAIRRRPWPHPPLRSKYNALQRGAYVAMPLVGALVVLSGWAMHKPSSLGWLERAFGNYDIARLVHFAGMIVLVGFLLPHVVLVIADGWDTCRAMVTGWSRSTPPRGTIEPPEPVREVSRRWLATQSRRSFLVFGAGVLAAAPGAWFVLPDRARRRWLPGPMHDALDTLGARIGLTRGRRERFLNRALTFDDDIAEALYSPSRRVRTYRRSQVTHLRDNYNGRTPGPEILNGWKLVVDGLAAGTPLRLERGVLLSRFPLHGQVTRLVCVEGWSAIAWWGGIRFTDFLAAFPPAPGARWAAIQSDVNLDGRGRPDPYYVSIDMDTLRHPQTLLATHHDGRPLTLAHGAPLRLLVPVKLGLKNIKAITHITYTTSEPPDYWHERGYSKYDGI